MDENAYSVIYNPVIFDGRAVLKGLIIEGGFAEDNNSLNEGEGAGLYSPGFFKLENCIFRHNYSEGPAGAIYSSSYHDNDEYSGTQHQNLILNCNFNKNRGGDGSLNSGSGGAIYIYNNGKSGGAIYNGRSDAYVVNCTILNNTTGSSTGGAMISYELSEQYVFNSIFLGNYGGGTILNGIRATEGTETTVWNSIFDVTTNGSRVTMETGNTMGADSSLVLYSPNDPNGIDDEYGTADDGWYLCTNSLGQNSGNPLDSSDTYWQAYSLTSIINDIIGVFDTDLVGNTRPSGSQVDIGAYEIVE